MGKRGIPLEQLRLALWEAYKPSDGGARKGLKLKKRTKKIATIKSSFRVMVQKQGKILG